eukprot:13116050-Ditylum_brightwellii.AAC.1
MVVIAVKVSGGRDGSNSSNSNGSNSNGYAPYPDEWGRSVAFYHALLFTNNMRYISQEQCYHPTFEDSLVAT